MAVTAITSLTSFLAPKLASAVVAAGTFVLTQLAQKAIGAVAGSIGQAALGAAASALQSKPVVALKSRSEYDLMISKARAFERLAQQTKSIQAKVEFLFAGIAALRLGYDDLAVGVPIRFLEPESPDRHELGIALWKQAAEALESCPADLVIDTGTFPPGILQPFGDLSISAHHAAGRCYFNVAITTDFLGQILGSQTMFHKEVFHYAVVSITVLKSVKFPQPDSLPQRASLQTEIADIVLRCHLDMHSDEFYEAAKAANLCTQAAEKSSGSDKLDFLEAAHAFREKALEIHAIRSKKKP